MSKTFSELVNKATQDIIDQAKSGELVRSASAAMAKPYPGHKFEDVERRFATLKDAQAAMKNGDPGIPPYLLEGDISRKNPDYEAANWSIAIVYNYNQTKISVDRLTFPP